MVDDEQMMFRIVLMRSSYTYHHQVAEQLVEEWHAFRQRYSTIEAVYHYLSLLKWPNGFICPLCEHRESTVILTRNMPLYQCRSCRHQTTLTAGTILQGTRTPLDKWLTAIFFLTRSYIGINARQLHHLLDVTYKTAWSMTHRIRQAISTQDTICTLGTLPTSAPNTSASTEASIIVERGPGERYYIIGAALDRSYQPQHVKMKRIAQEHFIHGRLQRTAVEQFEENHVAELIDVLLPRDMRFRGVWRLQNMFDRGMHWLQRTYGNMGGRHFQLYLDQYCYVLTEQGSGRQAFDSLCQLSISKRGSIACNSNNHPDTMSNALSFISF